MNIYSTSQTNQSSETHNGTLKVQAFTARRTYPVPGAEVTISKETPEGEEIFFKGQTDISGQVPSISLPGVKAIDSFNPKIDFQDTVSTYSYNITVTHPDFLTMIYYNVPVYEGIMSIQSADMIPKSVSTDPNAPIVFNQQQSKI